jgi:glycosyltransferase involved in cell wall biosynthesis
VSPAKVVVIPNGIDGFARTELDDTTPHPRDVPDEYFLTVGSMDPRKNLARLVTAYEQASETAPLPPLLVAGGGGAAFAAGSITRSARVRFLGRVSDAELIGLYSGARGVVNVSVYEGFGLTVVEAARFGVPILVSDIPPHRELLGDDVGTLWTDPWDTTDIAACLLRLSSSQPGAHQVTGHDWASAGAEYSRLFESLQRG